MYNPTRKEIIEYLKAAGKKENIPFRDKRKRKYINFKR